MSYGKKAEELIAYLSLQKSNLANKSTVSALLWESRPEQNAKYNLSKLVSNIRQISKSTNFMPIISHRGKLLLETENTYCDIWEFEELFENKTVKNWEKAESLYKGLLLQDEPFSWAHDYEGYYDIRYFEILEYLSQYYFELGNSKKYAYYKNKMDLF